MKKSLITKLENTELHHKLRVFILILGLTIIITRLVVLIDNPNITIRGYEMHHFYYGVILLVLLTIFRIFSEKHKNLYLNLSAVSIGLILDEFIFIMGNNRSHFDYAQTFLPALVFVIVVSLIAVLTYYLSRKKQNDKNRNNRR